MKKRMLFGLVFLLMIALAACRRTERTGGMPRYS
jgi:hypothetical protein